METLLHFCRRPFTREAKWNWCKKLCNTVTLKTNQGIFTVSTKDNAIGKELFCTGQYELLTIQKVFGTLTQRGIIQCQGKGTLLDVGSNCGIISVGILTHGYLSNAIAIEPEPLNFKLLTRNVRNNRMEDRITPLQYAVSDRTGNVIFELATDNLGDHRVRTPGLKNCLPDLFGESRRHTVKIQAKKLDDLIAELPRNITEAISLVWMDIQGYEGFAIRGAEALFKRSVPLMLEFWPYGLTRSGFSREEFCSLLKRYWNNMWILQGTQYERLPVDRITNLWNDVGETGKYENIILTV